MTRESTDQIPVVLFAFKRAASTQRVLQALRDQSVRPERLIAFVDDPPQAETQPAVDEVCNTIKKADWAHVRLVRRERNYGCNANILDGVSQALAEHRRAVILEDDVLPAPHFYEALCLLLDRYAADERVFSVGGFPHLLKGALLGYPFDAILSPRFSAWGWATWADRWTRAAPDLTDFRLPFELPEDVPLRAGDDLPQALAEAKSGAPTYWDLRLALLSLRRGWLHAHTRRALTANIGLASGEHPTRDSRAEQFMDYHCAVVDGAPRSFPRRFRRLARRGAWRGPCAPSPMPTTRRWSGVRRCVRRSNARCAGLCAHSACCPDEVRRGGAQPRRRLPVLPRRGFAALASPFSAPFRPDTSL